MSMGWYGMLCCVFTMEKKLFSLTDFTSNTIQKPSILPAVEVMSWAQPTNIMSKSCSSNSSGIRSFRVQVWMKEQQQETKKLVMAISAMAQHNFLFTSFFGIPIVRFVLLLIPRFPRACLPPVLSKHTEKGNVGTWWMYYKNGIEHFQFSEFA